MMTFLVELSNTIGMPVVLVGKYKARGILNGAVHQIRRGAGQGDMVWDRMPEGKWVAHGESAGPGVWQLFLESLWVYQYIRTPCELTPELAHALYEETQGITDFAAKVFMLAQARAITTSKDGKEELSIQIIRSVSADSLKQAQPVLRALRMGDTRALAQYDDMRHIDINPYLQASGFQPQLMPTEERVATAARKKPVKGTAVKASQATIKEKPKGKKKRKEQVLAENDLRHGLRGANVNETPPDSVLAVSEHIASTTEYIAERNAA